MYPRTHAFFQPPIYFTHPTPPLKKGKKPSNHPTAPTAPPDRVSVSFVCKLLPRVSSVSVLRVAPSPRPRWPRSFARRVLCVLSLSLSLSLVVVGSLAAKNFEGQNNMRFLFLLLLLLLFSFTFFVVFVGVGNGGFLMIVVAGCSCCSHFRFSLSGKFCLIPIVPPNKPKKKITQKIS